MRSYDLETHVPAFYHVTTASVFDSKVMPEIPLEEGAYYVFDRGYNAFVNLFRIDLMKSFFMIRAKKNLRFTYTRWKRRLPGHVLTDAEIKFTDGKSPVKYPKTLRLVKYHDAEQDRDFAFLTNAFSLTALEAANLYKSRWQIELFFKWLKQHLKIKRFWETTENAVRIQISVANHHVLPGSSRSEHLENKTFYLRTSADPQHLADRQNSLGRTI